MPLGWGYRSPFGGWPAYCGDVAGCPLTVLSYRIGKVGCSQRKRGKNDLDSWRTIRYNGLLRDWLWYRNFYKKVKYVADK